jgi:hypothetical protein
VFFNNPIESSIRSFADTDGEITFCAIACCLEKDNDTTAIEDDDNNVANEKKRTKSQNFFLALVLVLIK